MRKIQAKELLEKYNSGQCTEEEKSIIENWYLTLPDEGLYPDHLKIQSSKDITWDKLAIHKRRLYKLSFSKAMAIAAMFLICLCAGLYYHSVYNSKLTFETVKLKNDFLPGGNKATLILANGKTITLDNIPKGQTLKQSGMSITKTAAGQLVCNITPISSSIPPSFNSIVTPRGGQYQIILAEGTKVWLNASSSLKFPTAFTGDERKVELSGEAYFEVAKDKQHPFKVHTSKQEVEVLGTHFNVSSYGDENHTTTTLLEGSVRVASNSSASHQILKPGQQSTLTPNDFTIQSVDLEEVMSWKNGLFIFNNENLESIMRKISRWYNVDIEYKNDEMKTKVFGGSISRFNKVSQVLRMLEITGDARFKIENNKIIVMNK